jgi:hypothetical protein
METRGAVDTGRDGTGRVTTWHTGDAWHADGLRV